MSTEARSVAKLKPPYTKPADDRCRFASDRLAELERYIIPGSVVFASLLVRALLFRGCTVAEAMWAVHGEIDSGRYVARDLGALSPEVRHIVSEDRSELPAGIEVVGGRLHIDGPGANWGTLTLAWSAENTPGRSVADVRRGAPADSRGTAANERSVENGPDPFQEQFFYVSGERRQIQPQSGLIAICLHQNLGEWVDYRDLGQAAWHDESTLPDTISQGVKRLRSDLKKIGASYSVEDSPRAHKRAMLTAK